MRHKMIINLELFNFLTNIFDMRKELLDTKKGIVYIFSIAEIR